MTNSGEAVPAGRRLGDGGVTTAQPSAVANPSIRELRRRHAHALRMARIYRTRPWQKAVKRLATEIMMRVRPIDCSFSDYRKAPSRAASQRSA